MQTTAQLNSAFRNQSCMRSHAPRFLQETGLCGLDHVPEAQVARGGRSSKAPAAGGRKAGASPSSHACCCQLRCCSKTGRRMSVLCLFDCTSRELTAPLWRSHMSLPVVGFCVQLTFCSCMRQRWSIMASPSAGGNVGVFFRAQAAHTAHSHWQVVQLAPTPTPGASRASKSPSGPAI